MNEKREIKAETVVKKGTFEFRAACEKYLELFLESSKEDYIRKGIFQFGEYKGKCLGFTSKKIQAANLPMPFGCPDLFIQPTDNGGIIWFCDRAGCICVCCREDFTKPEESYPKYCPPPEGFEPEYIEEDYLEEEWEEEDW